MRLRPDTPPAQPAKRFGILPRTIATGKLMKTAPRTHNEVAFAESPGREPCHSVALARQPVLFRAGKPGRFATTDCCALSRYRHCARGRTVKGQAIPERNPQQPRTHIGDPPSSNVWKTAPDGAQVPPDLGRVLDHAPKLTSNAKSSAGIRPSRKTVREVLSAAAPERIATIQRKTLEPVILRLPQKGDDMSTSTRRMAAKNSRQADS